MTMRLKATCVITFEYYADPSDYYGNDMTKEQTIAADKKNFRDDQDVFFELADVNNAVYTYTVEEAK